MKDLELILIEEAKNNYETSVTHCNMPAKRPSVIYKWEILSFVDFSRAVKSEHATLAQCKSFWFTKKQVEDLIERGLLGSINPSWKKKLYLREDLMRISWEIKKL